MRTNCWAFKKCGRQPGGDKVEELGVCPTAVDISCNGINHGKNAGRYCWMIAGTLCEGKVQGTFAQKLQSCLACDFYKKVEQEEGTKMLKLNCWELKKCGRQPGGKNVDELGACPAATDDSSYGINDGKKAGRYCWAIAGTLCGETIQGTFAQKLSDCLMCEFYQKVREQEGKDFIIKS